MTGSYGGSYTLPCVDQAPCPSILSGLDQAGQLFASYHTEFVGMGQGYHVPELQVESCCL